MPATVKVEVPLGNRAASGHWLRVLGAFDNISFVCSNHDETLFLGWNSGYSYGKLLWQALFRDKSRW